MEVKNLQDLIHCQKHCIMEYKDDWLCGLKKHTGEGTHTQGCYFGTTGATEEFEIDEDQYFKLIDPDTFDQEEYVMTSNEIEERYSD